MEENGFAILMFLFGGALLLYALLLYWTKDSRLIPRNYATRQKGEKHARQFARIIALVSLAPMVCGGAVLNGRAKYAILILIGAFAVLITAGVRTYAREEEQEEDEEEKKRK